MAKLGWVLLFLTAIGWSFTNNEPENEYQFGQDELAALAGTLNGITADQRKILLPLKETEVHLEITGDLVDAQVRQVFYNDSGFPLEAVYSFPLPLGATITSMHLKTADQLVESVVRERGEAQATYEQAKREGRQTALLDQDRPNLFTTRVANLGVGDELEIRFSFLEILTYDSGTYELRFPTTFGPRYVPRPVEETMRVPASIHAGLGLGWFAPVVAERVEHRFHLTAEIRGLPIGAIASATHDIFYFESEPGTFRVELAVGDDLPDRDFSLELGLAESDQPQIRVTQSQNDLGAFGLATIFPPLREEGLPDPLPLEVTFLIDTSGSMEGAAIAQARKGLGRCLELLRPGDRFNIVRFSHDFSYFTPEANPLTRDSLARAAAYIDTLEADGGTEMQAALADVLARPTTEGHLPMVVFMTDGDVGNEEQLLHLVDQRISRSRLFSFGVGSAPNEFLLRKVSEMGHGACTFIDEGDDIGLVMANFFATVNAPVLTDITVRWRDGAGDQVRDIEVYPKVVPDVYQGRPVQLRFRRDRPLSGEIEVSGRLGERWVSYTYPVANQRSESLPGLAKIFGQARVNDFMSTFYQVTTPADREVVKTAVIQTALAYQLVTPFTSRVAVAKPRPGESSGNLRTVQVPVMAKASSFAATASDDYLLLMWAMALLLVAGTAYGVHRRLAYR